MYVCVCAGMSGHKKVHDPARESSGLCQGAVTSTLAGPGSEARGAGWRLERRARCCELESATSITSVQSELYTVCTARRLLSRKARTAGRKLVGLHASSIIPFCLLVPL